MVAKVIGSSTHTGTLRYSSQTKLVRDSNGYWYAVWFNENKEIFLVKSNSNVTGFDGNETPIEIVGNSGMALVGNGEYPSIVMDSNDVLHLVFRRMTDNQIWYVQWDTSTAMNNSDNWKHADGSTVGAERINAGSPVVFAPSIDVDSDDHAHVVWNQKDNNIYEIFYRYWNGSAWSTITQITDGSAQFCFYPSIAIDRNDHVHVIWRYDETDKTIRYGHTHNFINWYQSNDSTPITTGLSGERVFWEPGKDMSEAKLIANKNPEQPADLWAIGHQETANDIFFQKYTVTEGHWECTDNDIYSAGNSYTPTIAIKDQYDEAYGQIFCFWGQEDDTIMFRRLVTGVSWKTPEVIENMAGALKQPQTERNPKHADKILGYIFWDSTNGKIYFNTIIIADGGNGEPEEYEMKFRCTVCDTLYEFTGTIVKE